MKTHDMPFIDPRLCPGLSRLFSARIIKDLAATGRSCLARQLLSESDITTKLDSEMPLKVFYDELFRILFRSYRNEYIYKNAIADKVLLGRHSLSSSFMITEFRAGNCKADSVVLNGSSTVYEIKSAYDSVARLERQLNAYRQVFDRINVITSKKQLTKIERIADESVGLMVLSDRYSISTIREATPQKDRVDPAVIFDSLRKPEYTRIIEALYGFIPDVPNTMIYSECKKMFCDITPRVAHDEMVRVLKERSCFQLREFITQVPTSLKAASIACNLSKKETASFLSILEQPIGDCLIAC